MQPNWPIYIPSKGRWQLRHTVRSLEAIRVPFVVVIEAAEFSAYASVIDKAKLLVLDPAYQRDYDTCDDEPAAKSKGPGPARNFIWDHAAAAGAAWHWVIDDNVRSFFRFDKNQQVSVADGTIFRCMEDFCERYTNIAMAGPNYEKFVKRKFRVPPYTLNTRIYSCNLIRTAAPFRWRARYNEDTDLSLRMLKAGWCTVEFNAFLQGKIATQTVRGGNTDAFYRHEGTLPKSRMLVQLHPDCAELVYRFSRWHHRVDYTRFKQKLVRHADAPTLPNDDYGMRLVTRAQRPELFEGHNG